MLDKPSGLFRLKVRQFCSTASQCPRSIDRNLHANDQRHLPKQAPRTRRAKPLSVRNKLSWQLGFLHVGRRLRAHAPLFILVSHFCIACIALFGACTSCRSLLETEQQSSCSTTSRGSALRCCCSVSGSIYPIVHRNDCVWCQ